MEILLNQIVEPISMTKQNHESTLLELTNNFIEGIKETNQIFARLEYALENIEKKLDKIPKNREFRELFDDLKLNMVKYEQFILTLEKRFSDDLRISGELERDKQQYTHEINLEQIKGQIQQHQNSQNIRFQLWLKLLAIIGVIFASIFSIVNKSEFLKALLIFLLPYYLLFSK